MRARSEAELRGKQQQGDGDGDGGGGDGGDDAYGGDHGGHLHLLLDGLHAEEKE